MLRRKRVTQPDSMPLLPEDDALPEDLEIPEPEPPRATTAAMTLPEEPLFSALLRQAVKKHWPDDPVMTDFVIQCGGTPLSAIRHSCRQGG